MNCFRPQMQEKDHTLEVVTHKIRHEKIVVDKLRQTQILLNLQSNVCKYAHVAKPIDMIALEQTVRRVLGKL